VKANQQGLYIPNPGLCLHYTCAMTELKKSWNFRSNNALTLKSTDKKEVFRFKIDEFVVPNKQRDKFVSVKKCPFARPASS
jgi:hypothetical protein